MLQRLLITASIAALLTVPAVAQEAQDQGMSGQESQAPILKKKKKVQPEAQGSGQGMENQPVQEDQAAGQENQPTKKPKKSQEATGQQPAAQDQQMTEESGQVTKKKKKVQQNTQTEEMTGQQQGETVKKKKIQQTQEGQSSDQMTTGATGKMSTEIPAEKRVVVREKLVSKNLTRIERSKININISIGVHVPRTIRFYPVPAEVVALVPAYEGYFYFVLDDGTIVIVAPDTYEIVYVLTA